MPQVVIHWSSKPIEFVGRVGMIQISSSFAGAKNNPHVWHLLAEWLCVLFLSCVFLCACLLDYVSCRCQCLFLLMPIFERQELSFHNNMNVSSVFGPSVISRLYYVSHVCKCCLQKSELVCIGLVFVRLKQNRLQ